ncbi:MAG: phosphate acetyltransferase [Actinobacteria bacterium]|nr:phosphate acetyltransferase [Actinomycetota bacterium]
MARNLYITAMEPASGKSLVSLGIMATLAGRVERLGFFRPIVRSEPDPQVELIRRQYRLSSDADRMVALRHEEAARLAPYDELRKRVVAAYKELEQECDFVLCEGTDFTGAAPALDFGLNADLANELGAPVLVVVRAGTVDETVAGVRAALAALAHRGCTTLGVVVNRADPEAMEEMKARLEGDRDLESVYVLPEVPALAHPTVADVAAALGARVALGASGRLEREVRDVRVAAMSVEHFVDHLVEGTLVIVPGDRSDILLACLASVTSPVIPAVAGVLLTGGYAVGSRIGRLLEEAPFPLLEVPDLTHTAAAAVQSVTAALRPDDERKIATALGVFEANVDSSDLARRLEQERPARMTPIMFEYELIERARADPRHIVLPEGEDDRILRAAEILLRRGVVQLTVLGAPDDIRGRAAALGLDLGRAEIVDPVTSPLLEAFAAAYHELRRHKGVTAELALDRVANPSYFGTMLLQTGAVDGMVSGAAHTTADTIRPAFEIIRPREGVSVVSSVFLMCLADRVLVYGDCAVNPKPDAAQLADIAISSAETATNFGIEPLVAMLSYSTGMSGSGEDVDRVRAATEEVRARRPELRVEGPIQYDAAVDAGVAELKLPGSDVAGRATVFVFPDLEAGNVAYKAVQRSAGAVAIGPVLQGLRKPVNDLSRGCTVTDIVNTVAITAVQAQLAGPAAD